MAHERGCVLGSEVGYAVRFEDRTQPGTRVKFMTDGVLVRECLSDPLLRRYAVLMLDEAHDRSLNTDILLGLVKAACRQRPELRVLVTSATLDHAKFSAYFGGCPVLEVPGRLFPVDIFHSKTRQVMTRSGPASSAYVQAAAEVVLQIHAQQDEAGHVLVFLTGREDIEQACAAIRAAAADAGVLFSEHECLPATPPLPPRLSDRCFLRVLPMYGALSTEDQRLVFENMVERFVTRPDNGEAVCRVRKCIVATNIAETSITVPHVRFVVDAGFVKQKVFDPAGRIESLVTVPVSQVAATQRAGRCGRTGPGQCYRLYSEESYGSMMPETVPEIRRTNLANTVLYLKALGVADVLGFDFLDAPSQAQLSEALLLLHMLGALDDGGAVTAVGRLMSAFPLEPCTSRAVVAAAQSGHRAVLDDVLTIAAMVSVELVWAERPAGGHKRRQPDNGQQDLDRRGRRGVRAVSPSVIG